MFIEEAEVDHATNTIVFNGHKTVAKVYPLSIDVDELRRIADSPRALEYEKKLKDILGEKTIVRVDRVEPSKNIIRGFRAYRLMLERHQDLIGKVNFLAFLVPSRTHIRQYQRYLQEVEAQVLEVNQALGNDSWQPITVFYENNYTQAIAAMKLYDVLLENSIIDGMNLVAKEGPVINTRDGLIILTETAGAYNQLKEGVLGVSPADVEGTSQAMYEAITASTEDRARRASLLTNKVEIEDILQWIYIQINDIQSVVREN
jgi:trehalose 6-phosphate synthase